MGEITLDTVLEWARRQRWEPDITPERERYRLTPGDFMRWTPFVERHWECCHRDSEYVYVNEERRVILIDTWVWPTERGVYSRWQVEIWATEDGYEDRLDALVVPPPLRETEALARAAA